MQKLCQTNELIGKVKLSYDINFKRGNMKSALITGITGQDGSYLAELLLKKGYKVYGLVRRSSGGEISRISHLVEKVNLISGDLLDQISLFNAIEESNPDEVYNLAAQSFVHTSWSQPILTTEFTATGVTRLLEAIKKIKPRARFYQASSSEMFGKAQQVPQNEQTSFYPRSPYGVAKLYGHWITINYKESFNLYASSGILFNHESPRRGTEFVTRKITSHIGMIKSGMVNELRLGNLDAKRDWGFAGDYVEAMWLMLQSERPDNYVIATNETHSVKDFVKLAFEYADLDWEKYVKLDAKYCRPAEVDLLIGDYSKAKKELGWYPKTSFKDLVKMMVDHDIDYYKKIPKI